MAGIAGHNFRLIVGVNEFSGSLSEMSADYTVAEIDDSVSQTENMEYIPGQLSRTLTAGGRWAGEADDIDDYISSTISDSDFLAASMDGGIYDVGTFIKASKAVNASLGSRVNVNLGFRLSATDRGRAREVLRDSVAGTEAGTTTLTGDVIDLGASSAAVDRSVYLYFFRASGNTPPVTVNVQDAAAEAGPFTVAHTFNLTAASINAAITARRPVVNTASYALDRYIRVDISMTGAGRSGEFVVLQSL